MTEPQPLTDEERARYEWQLTVPGFGEREQTILKRSAVLVTRCGGVGGAAACQLAAAGVGRLVLAHSGAIQPSALNRLLLMTHHAIGQPRTEVAARRLRELNPLVEATPIAANVTDANVAELVGSVDLILSAAPRFGERLLLNREAVRQQKPLVDAAMYDLDAQL